MIATRRGFLKLLGAALGAAEFFGVPSGWFEPIKARMHTGTYIGDGAVSRTIRLGFAPKYIRIYQVIGEGSTFKVDSDPIHEAQKLQKKTGNPSGNFSVKGKRYSYEVME